MQSESLAVRVVALTASGLTGSKPAVDPVGADDQPDPVTPDGCSTISALKPNFLLSALAVLSASGVLSTKMRVAAASSAPWRRPTRRSRLGQRGLGLGGEALGAGGVEDLDRASWVRRRRPCSRPAPPGPWRSPSKIVSASAVLTTRLGSLGAAPLGIVMNRMFVSVTALARLARPVSLEIEEMPSSTVIDYVSALRNLNSRSGRVSTPALRARLMIDDITTCWWPRRPMSLPSPTAWRVRARARAFLPSSFCLPAGRSSLASRVDHRLVEAHVDAAERVDHRGEAVEVELHEVVDVDAAERLDGAYRARGPAGQRRVDHQVGAAGERAAAGVLAGGQRRQGVARDLHRVDARVALGEVHQHQGVAALARLVAVALGLELAGVRADEQDVGRALGGVVLDDVILLSRASTRCCR